MAYPEPEKFGDYKPRGLTHFKRTTLTVVTTAATTLVVSFVIGSVTLLVQHDTRIASAEAIVFDIAKDIERVHSRIDAGVLPVAAYQLENIDQHLDTLLERVSGIERRLEVLSDLQHLHNDNLREDAL